MAKYHINPKTGNPGACSAKEGNCPFNAEHFATKDEARAAYEKLSSQSSNADFDFEKMRAEALDPELEEWVTDGPLGRFLNHPLVQDMMVDALPGMANRQFLHKKKMVEEARAAKDWSRYIFIHERPYRAEKLYELHTDGEKLSKSVYTEAWLDSENIWQNREEWDEMLTDLREKKKTLGESLSKLPETVTVYRGANQKNKQGLSWSLDKEKAKWFSTRFQRPGERALVVKAKVSKDQIAGYITSRGESEIVIWPDEVDSVMQTAEIFKENSEKRKH